jgi:hypothetical protein
LIIYGGEYGMPPDVPMRPMPPSRAGLSDRMVVDARRMAVLAASSASIRVAVG